MTYVWASWNIIEVGDSIGDGPTKRTVTHVERHPPAEVPPHYVGPKQVKVPASKSDPWAKIVWSDGSESWLAGTSIWVRKWNTTLALR